MHFFPYDTIRPEQDQLLKDVAKVVSERNNLIAHAPTGLGKTAASLSPAVQYAYENGKTVFFLTSRQTQHRLAIDTLREIKRKHNANFSVVDLVGKQSMCARTEAEAFKSGGFNYYCKALRDKAECEFYNNLKTGNDLSTSSKFVMGMILKEPMHAQEAVELARTQDVCPYEIVTRSSKKAQVVVGDYFHLFNPDIRESILTRNSIDLKNVIVIVDEGHNLPSRMRDMLTRTLSMPDIERALKEANKDEERPYLSEFIKALEQVFNNISPEQEMRDTGKSLYRDSTWNRQRHQEQERVIEKGDITKPLLDAGYNLSLIIEEMNNSAEKTIERGEQSDIRAVADFLLSWDESDDEHFSRIISSTIGHDNKKILKASFTCLDPSIVLKDLIKELHSVILMSGTLTPTSMFKELLGFPEKTLEREYKNPMPKENRLSIIVSGVTTKYANRTDQQFAKIGSICSNCADAIPGNLAIFFPSYALMEKIHPFITTQKQIFKEHQGISKEEKDSLLSEFKQSSTNGGLLLAVIGGNFSEGVDLPGNLLNGVLIVGLPLAKPDLQVKALIDYYEKRYKRGWDYGYTFPAFTKALQAAGRCIRTETDRGAVLFIDSRYVYPNYYRCFPKDISPTRTDYYKEAIEQFFSTPS